MKTLNSSGEVSTVRMVFIEILSDEFISKTGVGVYAYLAPIDVNKFFKEYLHQSVPIRKFAKQCVRITLI